MRRTIVITGGTSGIGLALARHYTERGDRVVAVGSGEAGGRRLLREAPGATFVQADLSSVRRTGDLVERLRGEYPSIDALVLGAFRYNLKRAETGEGFEHTFALYVINRWLMAEGLRPSLEQATAEPVIVNLCGVGGIRSGTIQWDDLQATRRYRPFAVTMRGARANELLGAAFAGGARGGRTRYVLYNPLFVATGLFEPFRQPVRGAVRLLSALFAQPAAEAVPPIAALLDRPPSRPLSAFRKGAPVEVDVDGELASRLEDALRAMASATVGGREPNEGG
ncbi:SDR family NAD(P)-dependent oxidoreductase [Nonomuraea lactucae]|uniref:SDR family NAD(P)-dependent oxidoreductase n=1 Tax=Nonomuraea lactucae TaxID=2249762 RepID=UPI000DE2A22F|nr:SDR family NAD(P)-dependent oxidoreductase [Nonomuraea lactucae]